MLRRRTLVIAALAVVAGLAARFCTPSAGSGVVYATPNGEPLKLDLDYPSGPGPHPVVLFAPHRGDWGPAFKRDDRCRRVLNALTGRGYAVATIHYRLVGEHRFPAQIEDGKAAIRWLRANAIRLGLLADRMGAVGVSAGGYGSVYLGPPARETGSTNPARMQPPRAFRPWPWSRSVPRPT